MLWGVYAAMVALFIVLLVAIPFERTFVFYTAFVGTALMCAIAGVAGWWKLRNDKAEGRLPAWPDIFTVLVIQLIFFLFLHMASLFCPKYIAVIAELIVYCAALVVVVGEERMRDAVRWLYARKKAVALCAIAVLIAIPALKFGIPFINYKRAQGWLEKGEYTRAAAAFEALGEDYMDAGTLIKESRYREGVRLNEVGDAEQAYFLLQDIMDYSDVQAFVDGNEALSAVRAQYGDFRVGNVVTFGTWQDEPLEWGVLAQEGSRRLLISRESVARKAFNDEFDITYWETASLRRWLNDDFYMDAFSKAERAKIMETQVVNADNAMYRTDAGNDTVDRIFLLSIAEAEIYRSVCMDWFKSADCSFWLRSPGCSRIDAAHVTMGGGIDEMGTNIDWDADVRPVMWIDILDMAE